MKKVLSVVMFVALLGCMNSDVLAAELLDVRPVVAGNAVSIEISADIAMSYTFYNVPGQTRAVVDIAEADPERVEPLIVVNKGAVSSISVDRVQISDIVVSRIIFNLVSESDISVSATPDRKLLTVTFGNSPATPCRPEPSPESVPEPKPAQPSEPIAQDGVTPLTAGTPPVGANPAEYPPEAGEPAETPAPPPAKGAVEMSNAAVPVAPTAPRITKLEPVVPVVPTTMPPSPLTVKGIVSGSSYINIHTNQAVTDYNVFRLSSPARLVIDLFGAKLHLNQKSVAIGRFGISNVRIGVSPDKIRVVMDSRTTGFPTYTIADTDNGLRIHFK